MKALLLFHLRGGVRMGLRASAVIVAALAGWAVLQESPVAILAGVAQAAFDRRPAMVDVVAIACLAFLLPMWAQATLRHGLNGWMRHLPIAATGNRRGLALALVAVQLPLIVMLALGALVAYRHGTSLVVPSVRWILVLASGAVANMPVDRRHLVAALATAAAALALLPGSPGQLLASAGLLVIGDAFAGPIRSTPARRPSRTTGTFLQWKIAWRALGARMAGAYGLALMPAVAGWLFVRNNRLGGAAAAGAMRLAGGTALVLCLVSLTKALALRRPAWPLARSFPWSSTRRVAQDAFLLAGYALPVLLPVALQAAAAALASAALVPYLACRAAGYVRRIPDAPANALAFLVEGLVAASVLTLLPWTAPAWLLAASPALLRSVEHERRQKVTRWSDWQYADASAGTI